MPKNRTKLATPADIKQQLAANNLLRGERPETILAIKFDAANDNAALYTDPGDFATALRTAVDSLIAGRYNVYDAWSRCGPWFVR